MTAASDTAPKARWFIDEMHARMQGGDLQAALDVCLQGLQAWPRNEHLWQGHVNLLRRLGRYPEAMAVVNDDTELSRRARATAQFQMRAFEVAFEQGDMAAAADRLARLAEVDPDRGGRYLVCRAKLALGTGDAHAALAEVLPRVPEFPAHAQLRALVARLLTAAGQAEVALTLLSESYAATPVPELLLAKVRLLDQQGETEAALALLSEEAAQTASRAALRLEHVRLLEKAGHLDAALSEARAGCVAFPGDTGLHGACWRLQTATGQAAEAAEAAAAYLDRSGSDVRVMLAVARLHVFAGRPDAAAEVLDAAYRAHPDNPLVLLRAIATHLDDRYDPPAALAMIAEAEARGTATPAILRQKAKAQRQSGFIPEAVATLEALRAAATLDGEGHVQLATFLALLGRFQEAQETLQASPGAARDLRLARHQLLSDIAFQQADLRRARHHMLRTIALRNRDGAHLDSLAKLQLHAGDYSAAWTNHQASISRKVEVHGRGKISGKVTRSLLGQLLNEFRLFYGDRDGMGLRWAPGDLAATRAYFRADLAQSPGNTPAALGLMAALRRSGQVTEAPGGPVPDAEIPRTIWQFWDMPDLPDQVADVMAWNSRMNAGYSTHRFDYHSGMEYLKDKGEEAALRAFFLCPEAAGKADILRLAVLWHEGGIWLDADDRCAQPLDQVLDHTQRLIGYQETYWTIGNNFLAVRPGDPIIRAALEDATIALTGPLGASVWLSSGPGAITRAVALLGTSEAGDLMPGIWIMPLHRMQQSVVPHIRLNYKSSDAHWVRRLQSPGG